ncbi:hypothetical protein B0H14DRAFT_2589655 [Mycena olivaceomarginata]|nr:hypothetical protein B0H14DRAFT_2589655 [Mycena olivaceomarginata]
MSDPTLCCGRDANGNQCICMRAKETYIEEETSRVLCKNCDHIESAHPEPKPSIGAFVKGFSQDSPQAIAKRQGEVKSEPKIKSEPDPVTEAEEDEPDMRKAAKMRTRLSTGTLKKAKPLFIPGSDEPEPEAGPSGSSSNTVVVSDDEDLRLLPLPWEVPTCIKSPSPAQSFAPLSLNEDPPTFFDDFHYSPSPPAAADTGAPGVTNASSGSSAAPAAHVSRSPHLSERILWCNAHLAQSQITPTFFDPEREGMV